MAEPSERSRVESAVGGSAVEGAVHHTRVNVCGEVEGAECCLGENITTLSHEREELSINPCVIFLFFLSYSLWQPLSGIKRARVGSVHIQTDQDNVSQRVRVTDRPTATALSLTRPIPSAAAAQRHAFAFLRLRRSLSVRLSRHPNVLFGNMSTDRPTDRPQSHLAKSAARFVCPSVPLLQC